MERIKRKIPNKQDLAVQTECKIRQLQQETVQRKAEATVYFCQQVFNCVHMNCFYVKSITKKIEQ